MIAPWYSVLVKYLEYSSKLNVTSGVSTYLHAARMRLAHKLLKSSSSHASLSMSALDFSMYHGGGGCGGGGGGGGE